MNNWLVNAPLLHREHAARAFVETDIDAILTNDPVGIYHLTGISPVNDKMVPRHFEAFALLVADQREAVRLFLNDFTYYYLARDERPWGLA